MYLVLVGVTSLYGKRGSDLCASLYIRQQPCTDIQAFVILPIFVETVRLPWNQIICSIRLFFIHTRHTDNVFPQTRSLIYFTLLYLRSPHSFANTTDVRGIFGDQNRVQASHASYTVRFTHLSRTELRILNHRATTRCSVQYPPVHM